MKSLQLLRGAERELELSGFAVSRILLGSTFSVVPHIAPSFAHDLCFIRTLAYPRVAFLALVASIILSERAVSENSCNCGSCLIGEGNIACDRSFA